MEKKFQNLAHLTKITTTGWQWKEKGAGGSVKALPVAYNGMSNIKLPYSGKFSNGLIFKNLESSQAFSKIFFRN